MRVVVNWGSRNTGATFNVRADSLDGALRFLNARDEWGLFSGNFTKRLVGDARGNATAITLGPTFTITMPSWRAYRRAPQSCKEEWDRMWHALRDHEDGHRQIFEQGFGRIVRDLEALQSPTVSQVDDLLERANNNMQSEQDAHDRATDHGRSRGVDLNITQECRARR